MNFTDNFSGSLLISGSVSKENLPGAVSSPSDVYSNLFNFAPSMYGPLVPMDTAKYHLASNQILTNSKGETATYGMLNRSGYAYYLMTNVSTQIGLKYDLGNLTKGLSLSGNLGYGLYSYIGQLGTQTYELYQQPFRDSLQFIRYGSSVNGDLNIVPAPAYGSYHINFTGKVDYHRDFNLHSVGALAYFNYDEKIQPTWQTASAASIFSYLHQSNGVSLNYGFDTKYFAKLDFGYTGSDQFAPGKRYVFTPSFAAAWVASKENFLKDIKGISYLKFRGSFGYTANDRFSGNRLAYMDNLSISGQELGVGNPNLTAEKVLMQNLGMDLGLFKDISLRVDVFANKIDNMIVTDNRIPVYAGTYVYSPSNAPPVNAGEMENKGFDLGLDYFKQLNKNLSIFSALKLSYSKNKIIVTNEIMRPTPEFASAFLYTGNPIYQQVGYVVDYGYTNKDGVANGYINDEETLALYKEMYEKGGIGTPRLGDLIYKDENNDGKIDVKDYMPIKGSSLPTMSYSLSGGFQYKSVEFSFMFQGVGDRYVDIGNSTGINETYHEGIYSDAHLNAWTDERYANGESISFPSLGIKNSTSHLPNDFFVQNTSFIRLKNIELAYTLPQSIAKTISAQKIRITINSQNVFTWTKMGLTKHFDPEVPELAWIQPFRVINIGARLTF
jgi:TonB-linked SusC/RagA family outer membrane protein